MTEPVPAEPVSRPSSRGRGWLVLFPLLLVGMLVFLVPSTVEAVRVRFEGGTQGTFLVEQVQCARFCEATGTFQPADGGPPVAAEWGGQAYGFSVGQPVEAVLVEGGTTAFPPGGSWNWLMQLVLCAALLGALVASVVVLLRSRLAS